MKTAIKLFLVLWVSAMFTIAAVDAYDIYRALQRLKKTPVICKVCHCGKEACNRVCSEENMCALRCEQECGRRR